MIVLLGGVATTTELHWETAHAIEYKIQIIMPQKSNDIWIFSLGVFYL